MNLSIKPRTHILILVLKGYLIVTKEFNTPDRRDLILLLTEGLLTTTYDLMMKRQNYMAWNTSLVKERK